jgi:molecular chaperone GrpE
MKKDIKNDHDSSNKTGTEQDIAANQARETDKTQNTLTTCQKELQELKDKFLHVNADLHNFQTRISKERALWAQEAEITIFKELLPIIDDFERALVERQKHETSQQLKAWLEGFELIGKSLNKLLQAHGVHEINCKGAFDPQFHEALLQVVDQHKKPGEIVAVLQKGYQLKNTVIRPAKVSVAHE